MEEQCSVRIMGEEYSVRLGSPCQNPAKVIRDGKPYCGMHDPDAVKARRERRNAEADAKWASERERDRRREAILLLTYGISVKVFDQKRKEIREFLETLQAQIK